MSERNPIIGDPATSAIAWRRFRRMMAWMFAVALACAGLALAYLSRVGGLASIHMIVATIAGVVFTVLLATGLMLLAFLSSGTGHDDAAGARPEIER